MAVASPIPGSTFTPERGAMAIPSYPCWIQLSRMVSCPSRSSSLCAEYRSTFTPLAAVSASTPFHIFTQKSVAWVFKITAYFLSLTSAEASFASASVFASSVLASSVFASSVFAASVFASGAAVAALPPDVHADRLTAITAESAAANILFFIFTSPLYLYFLFSRLCKTAGRTLLPA